MATIISGSKLHQQMFKCFNCGRKTVTLENDFSRELPNVKIDDDDLDESAVKDVLEALESLQDEWLATCTHCGWSDN